ncbi:arsenate reductase (azurin) small subunit, partial [Vibrio splendidus]
MIANSEKNSSKRYNKCMMSRRDFLLYSGAAT